MDTEAQARTGSSPGRAPGAPTRRKRHAFRAAVLDAAALGGRLAAAWIATAWALSAPALEGGTRADLLAGAVLACAAAFAAGLAAPLSGALLAAAAPLAALSPLPPGAQAASPAMPPPAAVADGAAPWWLAVTAVCLLTALVPGRISADALVARRRGSARTRTRGPEAAHIRPRRISRRPEEAPPLPYPGGGAALTRPSRI